MQQVLVSNSCKYTIIDTFHLFPLDVVLTISIILLTGPNLFAAQGNLPSQRLHGKSVIRQKESVGLD